VRSDVRGTGRRSPTTARSSAARRLKGYVDMAAVGRYRQLPFSLQPADGFQTTLNVLAHEIAHQWLAYVRYRRDGQDRRIFSESTAALELSAGFRRIPHVRSDCGPK